METPGEPASLITEAEHLRIFLHDRDVPCPLCGYNLRGQSSRCPECGRELRLSVGLTEPFLRAWVALAFVAFGTAGIGILFWIAVVAERWPPVRGIGTIAFVYLLSSPALAALVTLRRRQLIKLPISAQWWIVVIAFVLSVAANILFFKNIR